MADGKSETKNPSDGKSFRWVWLHRFNKFLHPVVLEAALKAEWQRMKRGEPSYDVAKET